MQYGDKYREHHPVWLVGGSRRSRTDKRRVRVVVVAGEVIGVPGTSTRARMQAAIDFAGSSAATY